MVTHNPGAASRMDRCVGLRDGRVTDSWSGHDR
jgi:ABC-type lipoprotein export system ATPase subunit